MEEWTKEAKKEGKTLLFVPSKSRPDIMFSGAATPVEGTVAWCYPLGGQVFSIVFDPNVRWATTPFERMFRKRLKLVDFRKLALHEIWHVLHGSDHSNDPNSLGYYKPSAAKIDSASIKSLP